MIRNDYEYDLIHHPYLSEYLDQDSGVMIQSFTIPNGVQSIHGFRIKLSKYGTPGPVHYSIARAMEGMEIVRGTISPHKVLPVFELMVGDHFHPLSVQPGEKYYLRLWVLSGRRPFHAYRIYGPNTRSDTGGDDNIKLPYWWYHKGEWLDDLEIPLPQDYHGANLPDYEEGRRYRGDGSPAWNLSFLILTDGEDFPEEGEQWFEFVRHLVAEPFSEWDQPRYQISLGIDESRSVPSEAVIFDEAWGLQVEENTFPVYLNAIQEIRAFFDRVLGLNLEQPTGNKILRFMLKEVEDLPPEEESFVLEAQPEGVTVTAREPKGILRAIHWLEDQILLHDAPWIEAGSYRVGFRYRLRMVPGIYPSPGYFQLQDASIWTAGYLWRLARAGYNAIFFTVNMEEIVEDSAIFPEMNDPHAHVAIENLRRISELAAQYGVQVYVDVKTGYFKPFPEAVYDRLPHIRSFPRHGNYPCSGQNATLDFYKETLTNLFCKVPKLGGMMVVYDTEGFYSCFVHNQAHRCPYCKDYPVEVLSTQLFEAFLEALKAADSMAELVLWSYCCDEAWNHRIIKHMPPGVTLMTVYSQFAELERCGVRIRTDDYSLCSEEPSEYFLTLQRLAGERGMNFICKTEDAFGQEFVSTPYTPCLEQHQRRWDQLNRQHTTGFLSQYVHLGFMPGPCTDLSRLNVVAVEKDGQPLISSPKEKLMAVAKVNYGSEAAEYVVRAWNCFSRAIREYFPYTMGICRYPGPLQCSVAQPFNLDRDEEVPRRRSRGFVNDLRWTEIMDRFLVDSSHVWDDTVVSRCFHGFMAHYNEGNGYLMEALSVCQDRYRQALNQAYRVSRAQYLLVRSLTHFVQFIRLRDAYGRQKSTVLQQAIIHICEAEMEVASEALRLCELDSRIGFSCEGAGTVRGGLFTPAAIRQKIAKLQQTLDGLYDVKV